MVTQKKAIENEVQIEKVWNFLSKLNIWYNDISHYILAFIHRSIVNEKPDFAPQHNERLEYLWDAVLELAVTENLFHKFPQKPEWQLTEIRSAIVRWKNLAKVARELEMNEYLLLWKWEEKWWWRENNYLLANTVEAFIWAIFLDLGFKEAKKFIDTYIFPSIDEILEKNLTKDYKTNIQELAQAKFNVTPTYELLTQEGFDHDKKFTVWILFHNKQVWIWVWSSKKKAQEEAAKDAYIKLTKK